jgi:two-component system, NarL family, sensor histidine kinase DevS
VSDLDDFILRRALDESPDGILICDSQGVIRYTNNALLGITGFSQMELIGRTVETLVPQRHTHHRGLREKYAERPRTRPMAASLPLTARRSDGSEVPVEISLSPVSASAGTYTIASVRDISSRMAAEEKLQQTRDALTLSAERERIARDLHDTVLQRLFGLGLEIQAAAVNAGELLASRLDTSVDEIDRIIKEIRTSVFTLGAAQRVGSLGQELGEIISQSSRVLGFTPRLRIEGPIEHMLDDWVRSDLVATLREAIVNVARHSQATETHVDLIVADGRLTLRVVDNGIGPSTSSTPASGNGLRNMTTRALDHGGRFGLTAGRESGAELEWSVPIR